jgi:hypothetical protein
MAVRCTALYLEGELMFDNLKKIVKKYDKWCEENGLTQEQGRCCVPVRKEEAWEKSSSDKEEGKSGDDN